VEEALRRMAAVDEPLVAELPRRPGQKETRWTHLVGEIAQPAEPEPAEPADIQRPALSARVERLEELVAQLAADVAKLKDLLS
jgi:uncharacterized protein YceH (UPF0502 family)